MDTPILGNVSTIAYAVSMRTISFILTGKICAVWRRPGIASLPLLERGNTRTSCKVFHPLLGTQAGIRGHLEHYSWIWDWFSFELGFMKNKVCVTSRFRGLNWEYSHSTRQSESWRNTIWGSWSLDEEWILGSWDGRRWACPSSRR